MLNKSIIWKVKMSFAKKFNEIRKEKKLTQQAIADVIGIHVTQIKRYGSGHGQPSIDILKKIALALNVTTDSLLFEDSERSAEDDLKLQFEAISKFSDEEKKVTKEVLEGLIIKYEAKKWRNLA